MATLATLPPNDGPEFDVFISYADADRAWAEGYLLDALGQAGVRCHTEAAFALGVPRLMEFERAIKASQRTLLILSPAYMADDYSRFVDLLSQTYGLETSTWPVLPVILEPVKLPTRLALLTALDATDPADHAGVIERLCAELRRPAPGPAPRPPCPYPGMVPFREADSERFFGREREVEELLQSLRLHPFLTVIGPSGSGKSSLVFAGLIPALRRSCLFGAGGWSIRSLRPGERPMISLTEALGGDPADPVRAAAQAIESEAGAHRLLLVVDQFEELFTVAHEGAVPFQEALLQFVGMSEVRVVLTSRADFYPDLMASPLWPEIRMHRAEVVPLDEDGLRQAIVKPAEAVGVFVEGALIERLVADAAGEPGILPLVQETLVLLWEHLERRYLPLRAYEAIVLPRRAYGDNTGVVVRTGLQIAMAHRAVATLAALSPAQQSIARRIFLRLVQFGEGRADTRRQQTVDDLRASGDDDPLFEGTLRHLADHRLLTLSGEESAVRKVDISHEALIGGWPLLQQWVKERREAELTRRRLEAKVAEWVRLGRGDGGLLDEVQLHEAELWIKGPDAGVLGYADDLTDLIRASRTAQDQTRARQRRTRRFQLAAVGLIAASIGYLIYDASLRAATARTRAAGSVQTIAATDLVKLPQILEGLGDDRPLVDTLLARKLADPTLDPDAKLRVALALGPDDRQRRDYLLGRLLEADPVALPIIRDILKPRQAEIGPRLWAILDDREADAGRQFRAACALATYDPPGTESSRKRWEPQAPLVVDGCLDALAANPSHYAALSLTLRPVRHLLFPRLLDLSRDPARSARRAVAVSLLNDYADQVDELVALIQDADPGNYAALLARLQRRPEEAVPVLVRVVEQPDTPSWDDPPLDPAWPTPDVDLVRKITEAQGLIAERFALCQTMPIKDFGRVAEGLRGSGYRPVRVRPSLIGEDIVVAAVWARDGRPWTLALDLEADALRTRDAEQQAAGLRPVDVAAYYIPAKAPERAVFPGAPKADQGPSLDGLQGSPPAGGAPGAPPMRYAAAWVKPVREEEMTQMVVGARMVVEARPLEMSPYARVDPIASAKKVHLEYLAVQALPWGSSKGPYHDSICSAIRREVPGGATTATTLISGKWNHESMRGYGLHADVSLWSLLAGSVQTRRAAELARLEVALKANPKAFRLRSERADLLYQLARFDEAIAELSTLIEEYADGLDRFDLRLWSSLNDVPGIPTEGKNLIIVDAVKNVLHFRIFDGDGEVVVNTDEKRLTERARQIEDLRKQLESLWPPHELTASEKVRVNAAVTSIVGHTKLDDAVLGIRCRRALAYARVEKAEEARDDVASYKKGTPA